MTDGTIRNKPARLTSLLKNKFLQDNGIMFVSGILTGAVNYALYPFVSRFVSVEQFGEIQVIIAIVTQVSVIGAVIRIFIVNTIKSEKNQATTRQFIRSMTRSMYLVGIIIGSLLVVASPWLKDILQFESAWLFLPAAVAIIFGFQFMIPLSYLQSQKNFLSVANLQLLQGISKLTLGALLGYVGFGSIGVIWGVALASTASALISTNRLKLKSKGIVRKPEKSLLQQISSSRTQISYLTVITIGMASVLALLSVDTFLVKSRFPPEKAGQYAGVAIVARIIFFAASSIPHVMISSVKPTNTALNNAKAYGMSLGLMASVSAPILLIMFVFPDTVVRVMVGNEYIEQSHILFRLCLSMFAIGLINLMINYHMAVKEKRIVFLSSAGLAYTAFLIHSVTSSLSAVADAFLSGVFATLTLCLLWTITWNYRSIRSYQHRSEQALG